MSIFADTRCLKLTFAYIFCKYVFSILREEQPQVK